MDTLREQDVEANALHAAAGAVNAGAGNHRVTNDPVELAAAARAVQRSWKQFPYYAWRYGARGRQFSASDSGWLVTLCAESVGAAESHARWLGVVLASRGMPRWLLECHLAQLHEELVAARPAGAARYDTLARCAASLRAERLARLDAERFASLAEQFDATMDDQWRHRLRRVGGLLVAAVVDERCGIGRAVPSVEAWLCDPSRFPEPWISAARATIAAAREAVH